MAAASPTPRRTQAERTAQTKLRLIEAAVGCLMESGYAYTTTVEICSRAGLTRGAYNHHYAALDELFVDVLEWLYGRLASPAGDDADGVASLEAMVRGGWDRAKQPEFKAVLELWIASRNDAELGKTLAPAIERLSEGFAPRSNAKLAERLESDPELIAFYRLAFEAMIGLALGRATSREGRPVAHENEVIGLLVSMARARDRARAR